MEAEVIIWEAKSSCNCLSVVISCLTLSLTLCCCRLRDQLQTPQSLLWTGPTVAGSICRTALSLLSLDHLHLRSV